MFDKMRLWVILTNLAVLGWFFTLHWYRFKESGKACSGDYHLGYPCNVEFRINLKSSEKWGKH